MWDDVPPSIFLEATPSHTNFTDEVKFRKVLRDLPRVVSSSIHGASFKLWPIEAEKEPSMHRALSLVAALIIAITASLGVQVPTTFAKTCLTELEVTVQDHRIQIEGDAAFSRVAFTSFTNMKVSGLGDRTWTDDSTWPLPANTTKLSFEVNNVNASKNAEVIFLVYDQCGKPWALMATALPTSLFDPYPYPFAPVITRAPAQIPHR
jgi:hypothetical protein